MSGKSGKSSGGDWIDKLQQHNRNVALQQQADAAKARARAEQEKAHQAKLDREANDRHRAKMEAIAKQNTAIEAQRLKILQQEKESQEFSKQQSLRLYDISCMVNQLGSNEKPLAQIQLYYKLKRDFDNIILDAITDLQYRKLYSETNGSLQQYLEKITRDNTRELNIYRKYCELEHQVEPYLDDLKINSAKGFDQTQNLLKELRCFSAENPELAIDEEEIGFVQESIDAFIQRALEVKGLWHTLYDKEKIQDDVAFLFLLCDFFKIEDDIFSSEIWRGLDFAPSSKTLIHNFCSFCYDAWLRDSTLSDTIFQIFDSVENPKNVPAINKARKRLHTRIINVLKKRNQRVEQQIEKKIYKKHEIRFMGPGCLVSIIFWTIGVGLIPGFDNAKLAIGVIWGIAIVVIGIEIGESKKNKAIKEPIPELMRSLSHIK